MFCPKCGNQVPDGAAFCGSCGNKIQAKAQDATPAASGAAVTSQKQSAATAPKAGGISGIKIAAMVLAVVAIIFSFMPWFETSSTLQGIGAFGSGLGQFGSAITGQKYSIASFEDAYAPMAFFGLAGDLAEYSSSTPWVLLMLAFFAWLIGVVLLAIGVIVMLATAKHSKALLIVGGIVLAVVALLWFVMYASMVSGGYATGSATNALICAIASIVAVVLAITAKKTA